jgi:hypothetical protein
VALHAISISALPSLTNNSRPGTLRPNTAPTYTNNSCPARPVDLRLARKRRAAKGSYAMYPRYRRPSLKDVVIETTGRIKTIRIKGVPKQIRANRTVFRSAYYYISNLKPPIYLFSNSFAAVQPICLNC